MNCPKPQYKIDMLKNLEIHTLAAIFIVALSDEESRSWPVCPPHQPLTPSTLYSRTHIITNSSNHTPALPTIPRILNPTAIRRVILCINEMERL